MYNMEVTKRNGVREQVQFDKISKGYIYLNLLRENIFLTNLTLSSYKN